VNKSCLRAIVSKDNNDILLVKVIILFPRVIRVELIHNHLHVLLSRDMMTSPYIGFNLELIYDFVFELFEL